MVAMVRYSAMGVSIREWVGAYEVGRNACIDWESKGKVRCGAVRWEVAR